jgi:hypothetical protein
LQYGGVNAQVFTFPCPNNPNPRDVRDVYLGVSANVFSSPWIDLDLCDQTVTFNTVLFKFPNFTLPQGYKFRFHFGDANNTVSNDIVSGETVPFTYPINTGSSSTKFFLWLEMSVNGVYGPISEQKILTLNPSSPESGGIFTPPTTIPIEGPNNIPPPVAGAFPNPPSLPNSINVYNGNTTGGADVYIKYAAGHNGKLLKPLIFVDGIDFDPTTYTYNGQVVRHGSTGWDVFQLGNSASGANAFDPDNGNSELRSYPGVLKELGQTGNDYDIVFVDFRRGADWIEKNGEVLIKVIEFVNKAKIQNEAAGLCTFDNVVLGASMGGQVAKWALSTMEKRGLAHETHTYISFDSPQKGANIPIGIQAFAFFGSRAGNSYAAKAWYSLNTPAARQLLVRHLTSDQLSGKITLNLRKKAMIFDDCLISDLSQNLGFEYTKTAEIRSKYKQDIEALGYPSIPRKVAVACGSANGLNANQGFLDGAFLLNGGKTGWVPACGSGQEFGFDCQILASNGSQSGTKKLVIVQPAPGVNYCCFEYPGAPKTIFKAAYPIDFNNYAGKQVPAEYLTLEVTSNGIEPDFDSAPGCKRGDLASISKVIDDQQGNSNISPSKANYYCFIPTISALDVNWPMDNAHLFQDFDPKNSAFVQLTPFKATWSNTSSDNKNLRHIELDGVPTSNNTGLSFFILDQMQKGLAESVAATTTQMTLNQTFNYGANIRKVPNTNVNAGGKLGVNLLGKANFQTATDVLAPYTLFEAYTDVICGVSELIDVKNSGTLQLGEPTVGNPKKGILHVINNSTVHIQTGGNLRISDNSELIIYAGSTLILEAGAKILLDDHDSKIILRGGTLQINGDIAFNPLSKGCFQFDGGLLTYGVGNNRFKLVGGNQTNRFIRGGFTVPTGGHLDLQKGTVEQTGSIVLNTASNALFTDVNLTGENNIINLVAANNAGEIKLSRCNVSNCTDCLLIENGSAPTTIHFSNFKNYVLNAINMLNRPEIRVSGSNFDGTTGSETGGVHAISANNVKYVVLKNTNIINHSNSLSSGSPTPNSIPFNLPSLADASVGVLLNNVTDCVMHGGLIDFCDIGVANLDGTMPSEFFMYGCATINRCGFGINMNGNATNGMVTMDGAKITNCSHPIEGTDILLNIQPTCNRNNQFIVGYYAPFIPPYIKVCYVLKTPPIIPIPMKNNHWAYWNGGWVSDDLNPASHMAITRSLSPTNTCNISTGVDVSGFVPATRFRCDATNLCWEEFTGTGNEGYKESCTMPVTPATIESQFLMGYKAYLNEDLPTAFQYFQPLSNMESTLSPSSTDWCKQYVAISRAMVEPNGTFNGSGNNRSNDEINEYSNLIRPNPASEFVEISLSDGTSEVSGRVTITDIFGRKVWENDCTGKCDLSLAGWSPGMYSVQIAPDGNVRPFTLKLMATKL